MDRISKDANSLFRIRLPCLYSHTIPAISTAQIRIIESGNYLMCFKYYFNESVYEDEGNVILRYLQLVDETWCAPQRNPEFNRVLAIFIRLFKRLTSAPGSGYRIYYVQ